MADPDFSPEYLDDTTRTLSNLYVGRRCRVWLTPIGRGEEGSIQSVRITRLGQCRLTVLTDTDQVVERDESDVHVL